MDIKHIPTPALLVDLDAMESNLLQMSLYFADKPAKLRPHFKNHKSPTLAAKQLGAGAIGMTCATLREAEILIEHGVRSILIANEIAGELKAMHLAELSKRASVLIAVDHPAVVKDLARAQRGCQTRIQVLVDIDIGLKRCGVASGEAALALASLARSEGLEVCGLMGYDGHLQSMHQSVARDELVRAGSKILVDAGELLRKEGLPVPIISTGGTGTYAVSGNYPDITEIQAGSYLLMDTLYVERGAKFLPSLTMLATVISVPGPYRAVIDCGVKALSAERGISSPKHLPGIQLRALHAEHGLLEIDEGSATRLAVGQTIELWVRYSDATVNLHSTIYGVRNGQVQETFRIEH